jgi:hypothetical protein
MSGARAPASDSTDTSDNGAGGGDNPVDVSMPNSGIAANAQSTSDADAASDYGKVLMYGNGRPVRGAGATAMLYRDEIGQAIAADVANSRAGRGNIVLGCNRIRDTSRYALGELYGGAMGLCTEAPPSPTDCEYLGPNGYSYKMPCRRGRSKEEVYFVNGGL